MKSLVVLNTLALVLASVQLAEAQAIEVTNRGGWGPGSLHEAIVIANNSPGPDVIVVRNMDNIGTFGIRPAVQMVISDSVSIKRDPNYPNFKWKVDTIVIDNNVGPFTSNPLYPEELFLIQSASGAPIAVEMTGFDFVYRTPVSSVAMRAIKTSGPVQLNLEDGIVRDFNRAEGSGFLLASQTNANITRLFFDDNGAGINSGLGGAIKSTGAQVTVHDSEFESNQANKGGAVAALGGIIAVHGSTFYANNAGGVGGALYLNQASADLEDSTFSSNAAGTSGGQFAVLELSTLVANHITAYNGGADDGGSLHLDIDPASAEFNNSLVFGNEGTLNCLLETNSQGVTNKPSGTSNVQNDQSCGGLWGAWDKKEADLGLLPLGQDGLTRVHGIDSTGFLFENADDTFCTPTDQRGLSRSDPCDVGAVEKSQ